jgi:hypothetical protein
MADSRRVIGELHATVSTSYNAIDGFHGRRARYEVVKERTASAVRFVRGRLILIAALAFLGTCGQESPRA